MLAYRVNKDRCDLISSIGLILEEGVGISIESVLVVSLIWKGVVEEHVDGEQIHHCLLPCDWPVWVY
jgi:hypothetical protein